MIITSSVDFWTYVRVINCHFHLFWASAPSFSSQYLLFHQSSRNCVLLLLVTPFTTTILMTSWRRQFFLRIWLFQLTFLHRVLFRSVLFPSIRTRNSLVTLYFHFIFSILLQHHISKFFLYLRSNFLSVQVSEP